MAIAYPTLVSVLTTDTFEEWRKKTNAMIAHTEANKLNMGDVGLLSTDDKFSVINAINEVDSHTDSNTALIGDLSLLVPDILSSDIVSAINNNYTFQKNNTDTQVAAEETNRKNADAVLQAELDLTQSSVGILANGTFNPMSGSAYLGDATSLQSAVATLDGVTKTKSDLLDDLIKSVANSARFDWTDSTVNYLTVELDGKANVKKSLVVLDNQIKINTNAQVLNTIATNQNLTKITNIISTLGVADANGNMVVDPRNIYATATNIKDQIKLLDDTCTNINTKLDGPIDLELNSLQEQINLRATNAIVGDISDLNGAIGATTVVGAINDLYTLLRPFLVGEETLFVRKVGDTMTGTLNINGGDLNVLGAGATTAVSRKISCSGDIIAYIGS
jgi:hypothetical protein